MRIEDTVGSVTYTIPCCDCGLTSGCDKCQPIHISNTPTVEYHPVEYHPSPRFDPAKFYRPVNGADP